MNDHLTQWRHKLQRSKGKLTVCEMEGLYRNKMLDSFFGYFWIELYKSNLVLDYKLWIYDSSWLLRSIFLIGVFGGRIGEKPGLSSNFGRKSSSWLSGDIPWNGIGDIGLPLPASEVRKSRTGLMSKSSLWTWNLPDDLDFDFFPVSKLFMHDQLFLYGQIVWKKHLRKETKQYVCNG